MNEQLPVVKRSLYSVYIKRLLDIVLSAAALVLLSPVIVVLALLELRYHGRPVLYKTHRPGRDGKVFELYKFRSMTNERGEDGLLLTEDKRLTKFGRFIRKTSLDELPSLWNVLKGDMSIIGPRPLLLEYLPMYSPRHAMRHAVRPGLACGHIVKDHTAIWTWREQFENDIYYVEHVSFLLDVKMLWLVVMEVFKASDYRADDTRAPFLGNNLDETRNKGELENVVRFDSIAR